MNLIVGRSYLRQIKRDFFLTNSVFFLLNTLAVTGFGFLFWWASARVYSPNVLGEFVVAITTAQLITTMANFGLSYSIIRYLPVCYEEKKIEIINTTITIVILFSTILSILVLILAQFFPSSFSSRSINGHQFFLFLVFVVSLGVYQLLSPVLAVLRSGIILLCTNIATGMSRVVFLVSLSLKFDNSQMLVVAYALPTCLACIFLLSVTIPKLISGFSLSPGLNIGVLRSIRKYSLLSYGSNVLHDLPYQMFPQYISNQIGLASATYFYISWNFFNLITTLANSFSLSMFVEGSYRINKVSELTRKNIISVVLLTGAIAASIFILAHPLLQIFGNDYAQNGVPLLRIITITSIPAVLVYSLVAYLRVKMSLFPVITALGIIAVLSISFSEFHFYQNLAEAGITWGISQIAALTFLLIYINWRKLSGRRV
jgi:O-antigen/teichoic acid export membrane protein